MNTSLIERLPATTEWLSPTPEQFRDEILPGGRPAVLRGVASDWPLVIAARLSAERSMALIEAHASPALADVLRAEPSEEGRFHYRPDGSLNFIRGRGNVAGLLAGLREEEATERPSALAAQGLIAEHYLPGFARAHAMPLVPPSAEPRLWIGNAAKVATHNDPIDNLAVVAAGRRCFTLFPPDVEPYLYIGPKHPTPAGTPISMVHVTAPDFDLFPFFARALASAEEATLSPGDALFIPRDWFHHVEALDRFNLLVNYWWDARRAATARGDMA